MTTKTRLGTDPFAQPSGVDLLIRDTRTDGNGKQSKPSKQGLQKTHRKLSKPADLPKSIEAGLKTGWTRATFIVRQDNLEKVKDAAWWERRDIKDVLDDALSFYLKGKKIPSRREH